MYAVASLATLASFCVIGCATPYVPASSKLATVTNPSGSIDVFEGGVELDDSQIREKIQGEPEVLAEYEAHRNKRSGAILLYVVGFSGSAAGAAVFGYDVGKNAANGRGLTDATAISLGISVGSLVVALAAASLLGSSRTHLVNTVNIYNDHEAQKQARAREDELRARSRERSQRAPDPLPPKDPPKSAVPEVTDPRPPTTPQVPSN